MTISTVSSAPPTRSAKPSPFRYDPNGNLLSLTDALGHANTFTYDTLNRPLTRKTPLGKTDTRKYDLAGNLTKFTDRRGQVSKFAYDPLRSIHRRNLSGWQRRQPQSMTPMAVLLNVADTAGGAFTYAYDLDSRLIGQGSPTGAIQYAYDPASELTARQVAGQPAATYAYDPAGRLLQRGPRRNGPPIHLRRPRRIDRHHPRQRRRLAVQL